MRTRPFPGLTPAVLAAHLAALALARDGPPRPAPVRAGVLRIALDATSRGATTPILATTTPVPSAPPAPRAPPRAARPATPPPAPAPARRAPVRHAQARLKVGAGGPSRVSPRDAAPWPVYPTRPPPSLTLHYALVQTGAASSSEGEATLGWRRDGDAFSLRLQAALAGKSPREWQSEGGFDRAGLAPRRLVERERGHDRRALSIDAGTGQVHFSGAVPDREVAAGVQDRWSWIAQLAAIAEAGPPPPRGPWELQVAGLRGELQRWTFQVLPPEDPPPELRLPGKELSSPDDRAPALLHVLHDPGQPYQLRVEAWLSPALHHLPAGVRLSTPPGPWSLSLWQRDP